MMRMRGPDAGTVPAPRHGENMAEQQWDEVVRSYLAGSWQEGDGSESFELINPATGETLATGSTGGLDRDAALRWAREKGSPALREMSFAERGEKLRGLAKALHEHRERFIDIAIANGGNTRKDAKFDIDGATGTLQYYGSLAKGLGDQGFLPDGEGIQLGRSARWWGQHILVPRRGVAVHINAFNFPAWGAFEKAAVAWLAGMSVLTKPAPATALLTVEMAKVALESGLLPEGALQVLAGEPGDLLEHVEAQDVVAFTGSSETGAHVRGSTSLVEKGVPVNIEADSLNAAVLGADVERGSEAWHLFVNDVVREITQKAGQKCTAVRRILVPESMLDEVEETLIDRLSSVTVGDPAHPRRAEAPGPRGHRRPRRGRCDPNLRRRGRGRAPSERRRRLEGRVRRADAAASLRPARDRTGPRARGLRPGRNRAPIRRHCRHRRQHRQSGRRWPRHEHLLRRHVVLRGAGASHRAVSRSHLRR